MLGRSPDRARRHASRARAVAYLAPSYETGAQLVRAGVEYTPFVSVNVDFRRGDVASVAISPSGRPN